MEGDGGEKKEVRRPMNAFLIFCKRHRSVVREKNPDMDNRSVTRVLGDLWANLGEEKATYTNLAKQYKDAFMKANPNYKWHNSERSQNSSNKMASKPTNSRVIKNVAEIPPDGDITPGKLADPEKMGGLNLLLMADKETRDSRASSSTAIASSLSLPLTTASTAPPFSVPLQADGGSREDIASANSALLQLAEMCTSELQCSGKDKARQQMIASTQPHPLPQKPPPVSLSLSPFPPASLSPSTHQPKQPPKKRARHWSLTEQDNLSDNQNPNDNKEDSVNASNKNYSNVNLSPLNLTMPKPRQAPSAAVPNYEEKYSSVEKYKSGPPRRRLSSSATESIPSPSAPYIDGIDDADSPVFSSDGNKPDNYASNGTQKYQQQTFSTNAGTTSINSALSELRQLQNPLSSQHIPPVTYFQQRLTRPLPALQQDLGFDLGFGTSKLSTSAMKSKPPQSHASNLSFTDHQPSPGKQHSSDAEIKLEKNSPDFHQWRDPTKAHVRTENRSPTGTRHQVGDLSNSSLVSILNQGPATRVDNNNPSRSCAFSERRELLSRSDETGARLSAFSKVIPSTMSNNEPANSKPVSNADTMSTGGKLDFSSLLSEGRIASLLSSTSTPPPKLMFGLLDKSPSQSRELSPHKKEVDREASKDKVIGGDDKKLTELNIPALKLPSSNTVPTTFSEGKLKKKWTERMMEEAKMEEDLSQQRIRENEITRVETTPTPVFTNSINLDQKQDSSPSRGLFSEQKREPVKRGRTNPDDRLHHSRDALEKEGSSQGGKQKRLILNQPLDSMRASAAKTQGPLSFNSSSHPKLMLQLSQNPQPGQPSQSQTYFGDVKIKSEPNAFDRFKVFGDSKPYGLGCNPESIGFNNNNNINNRSSSPNGSARAGSGDGSRSGGSDRNDSRGNEDNSWTGKFSKTMHTGEGSDKKGIFNSIAGPLSSASASANSSDLSNKQALNPITACGKKFVDHIVEQLFRTDFSGVKTTEHMTYVNSIKELPTTTTTVKSELWARKGQMGRIKEEKVDDWRKKEEMRDYKVMTASSLVEKVVREVCGSPPKKEACSSCRKHDQAVKIETASDVKGSLLLPTSDSPPCSAPVAVSLPNESSANWDTYRQAAVSPTNETDSQSQWSVHTAESNDPSDLNEDTAMQPVRKSRRANRGQKYQELIKEGFIQPSRERMAARNAERHGRSFGTREEYEQMEAKKILKRSASERDMPSEGASHATSGGPGSGSGGDGTNSGAAASFSDGNDGKTAVTDLTNDKRFTSGDFDLEKEIESLPVCSVEQLGKKKTLKRRADGETGVPGPRQRSNSDVTAASSHSMMSMSSPPRHSVAAGSEVKFEEGCPAPHIPLPATERPMEPVTGSRKRKARKHCITRISVLEGDSAKNAGTEEKDPKAVGCEQKKYRSQSVDMTAGAGSTAETSIQEPEAGKRSSPCQVSVEVGKKIMETDDKPSDMQPVSVPLLLPSLTTSSSSMSQLLMLSTVPSIMTSYSSLQRTSSDSAIVTSSPKQKQLLLSSVSTSSSPLSSLPESSVSTSSSSLKFSLSSKLNLQIKPSCTTSSDQLQTISVTSAAGAESLSSSVLSVPSPILSQPSKLGKPKSNKSGANIAKKQQKQQADEKPKKSAGSKRKQETTPRDAPKKKARGKVKSDASLNPAVDSINKGDNHLDKSSPKEAVNQLPQLSASLDIHKPPVSGQKSCGVVDRCKEFVTQDSVTSKTKCKKDKVLLPKEVSTHPTPATSVGEVIIAPTKDLQFVKTPPTLFHSSVVAEELTRQNTFAAALLDSRTNNAGAISVVTSSPSSSPSHKRDVGATFHEQLTTTAASPTSPPLLFSVNLTSSSTPNTPHASSVKDFEDPTVATSKTNIQEPTMQNQKLLPNMFSEDTGSKSSTMNHIADNSSVSVPYTIAASHCSHSIQLPLSSSSLPSLLPAITSNATSSSSSSSSSQLLSCNLSSSPLPTSAPSTVISLATSTPSTKNDIVSYAVISSSSVIDAGSPHMIGSPHLPESPSVAVVQS